jgi:hypothetical protein
VAARFINNLLKKIGDKHPSLMSILSEGEAKKTGESLQIEKKQSKAAQHTDSALVAQL